MYIDREREREIYIYIYICIRMVVDMSSTCRPHRLRSNALARTPWASLGAAAGSAAVAAAGWAKVAM